MLGSTHLLLLIATVTSEPPQRRSLPPKADAIVHVRRVGEWLGSPPLLLDKLEGKVILVHSVMPMDGCPLSAAVTPALNALEHDLENQGLAVVALYQKDVVNPSETQDLVLCSRRLQAHFALLTGNRGDFGRWKIKGRPVDLAKVTFLVDKRGIIRRVAPEETLVLGTKEYDAMKAKITKLLTQ